MAAQEIAADGDEHECNDEQRMDGSPGSVHPQPELSKEVPELPPAPGFEPPLFDGAEGVGDGAGLGATTGAA
jgi:hypothetical protein